MMEAQLRRVLVAENPWLRGEDLLEWIQRFLPTSYIPRRLRLSADHRVVLVVGPRRGALLENLAFAELAKTVNPLLDGLSAWRSKSGAEIDFVVEHQGRLLACEIKAGDSRASLSRSARSFVDAYQPEQLLVVNRRGYPEMAVGATRVRFLQIEELSTAVEGFLAADRVPGAPPLPGTTS